jgi:uncharacterized protein
VTPITDPLFYLCAIPAVALLGLAKGGLTGLGLAAVPLMSLAVPAQTAAAVVLPILLLQDVVSMTAYRRAWHGPSLAVLLSGGAAGMALAWGLADRLSVPML